MSRSKFSAEEKERIVREYLEGKGSYETIAGRNGIEETTVRRWVINYKEQGISGLRNRERNSQYTRAFKMKCVEAVMRGEGSVRQIAAKYNISNESVLTEWIKVYNANMELKDYEPKREVYMAEARTEYPCGDPAQEEKPYTYR